MGSYKKDVKYIIFQKKDYDYLSSYLDNLKINEDCKEYLYNLLITSLKFKFLRTNENWYGSWEIDGEKYFLIIFKKDFNKNNYYLICYGNDDFSLMLYDLTFFTADELFEKLVVKEIVTKEELDRLGFRKD